MTKAIAFTEFRIGFSKEFKNLNRKEILEEHTYLYDKLLIDEIEIKLTMSGGKIVTIDLADILDYEVKFDDIYVDDEILE